MKGAISITRTIGELSYTITGSEVDDMMSLATLQQALIDLDLRHREIDLDQTLRYQEYAELDDRYQRALSQLRDAVAENAVLRYECRNLEAMVAKLAKGNRPGVTKTEPGET